MKIPDLLSTNYAVNVQKLRVEFTGRFPEFRRDEIKVNFFAHPLDLAVDNSPDDCQMELIELQAHLDSKSRYSENSLVDFYKLHVCGKFSNLFRHARKMIYLFGSTYCCEQVLQKKTHQNQMRKSAD